MSTEKFDLIVKFKDDWNEDYDEELLGIEEIENALENMGTGLYIKESECINVVLVELGIDSLEAARKLRNTQTKMISRVVPINTVVETRFELIINKVKELSMERTHPGDTFFVNCAVMNENKLRSPEIENAVKEELNKIELNFNEENPKWNVYVEVIGENTGLSVLKSSDFNEVSSTP